MKSFSSVFSWRNRACQLEVWAHCEYGGHTYSDFTSCRWLRVEAYELTKKVLLRLDIPGDLNLGKMMPVEMEKKGRRSLAGPKNKGQSSGCAEMVRVRACVWVWWRGAPWQHLAAQLTCQPHPRPEKSVPVGYDQMSAACKFPGALDHALNVWRHHVPWYSFPLLQAPC